MNWLDVLSLHAQSSAHTLQCHTNLFRTPGSSACNAMWEARMAVTENITSVAFSGFPLSSRLLGLSGAITVPRKNRAAKTQAKPRLKRHPQV